MWHLLGYVFKVEDNYTADDVYNFSLVGLTIPLTTFGHIDSCSNAKQVLELGHSKALGNTRFKIPLFASIFMIIVEVFYNYLSAGTE